MIKEPGWERFRDVVVVDTGGRVEVLDEDGVIGSSSGTHDSTLVNVFNIAGLHGEPVDDDGEVRYLPTIFLESFWTFDCVGVLVGTKAMLEVFNSGLAPSSDGIEVSAVFGLL